MLFDLNDGPRTRLAGDVAIVGAGAAGLTLARRLVKRGLSVVLLESGGLDYEPETAALNRGDVIGHEYPELEDARLRFFGGTTAIWGGRCAELDPIDFAPRSWVPHSGWPIDHATLAAYYREAREHLGLPDWHEPSPPLDFDGAELRFRSWQFDQRFDRFSAANSRDLLDNPRVTLVTHATVRELILSPSRQAIEAIDAVSLRGGRLKVHATHFVLAAGGIETPRIMLASRSVDRRGIGNDRDLVGRFFMEHPHARGGRILDARAWPLLGAFRRRHARDRSMFAHLIAASPALQEREGLLNSSLTIAARPPAHGRQSVVMQAYASAKHKSNPDRRGRVLWRALKQTTRTMQSAVDPARPWLMNRLGLRDLAIVVRAEQAPNPDSRVVLGEDRDALGIPRVQLDWKLSELDVTSVAGLVGALRRELERKGLGRVEPADWLRDPSQGWVNDSLVSMHPIGGYHHMGTTRMATDRSAGVVDADCKVHGIANLHIAGSSVFPTGGWANPTLTIMALALRLGDRIAALSATDKTLGPARETRKERQFETQDG
ncbi:FAD-dependent oxidoreductase [Novosphingobium aquimarinum]|uniref:FAD-dependent oxidoreductase n=1 Tax=Novosphingobium aquimarinum TaxID=2682494 RepID=UPI0012EB5A8C|nr:GMC family oxidoreductase [Novosphingobium aquimarinum]